MTRLLFVITLLQGITSLAQNQIVGIVYQNNSEPKIPIKNADISIPGVGRTTSDNDGTFAIGLSQCLNCSVGKTVKVYVNSTYGYGETEYTIPADPNLHTCEIPVSPNQKISLNGIVSAKRTGALLKGIKVTIVIQNYPSIAPAITDDNGIFNIIIRKEGLPELQAIQLVFSDDNNKYQGIDKVVFINKFEPIKVQLDECQNCGSNDTLSVDRNFTSGIYVEKGDLVTIKANGAINVGPWVGNSGPEGIARGVGNIPLTAYCYFKTFNHGALVYRIGNGDDWKCYSLNTDNSFISSQSGYLNFVINDNDQANNTGYYTVVVNIKK